MNKRLGKLLFSIAKNSRITTKNLSKQIHTSQQSASYAVTQLMKKRIIRNYNTIVDPIKLGFTNIIVGINYLVLDSKIKKEILNEFKNIESIISIQEADEGADLIVEYCVSNLSAFNKIHTEITHKLYKIIETKFIFPVVVKHKFNKSYLVKKRNDYEDIIICGDRETRKLSENELKVLKELVKRPDITFTKLSQKTKISARTIVNIKKRLEASKIIRGYSCTLNHKKIGIDRKIILLTLTGKSIGEINKLVEYSRVNKNIVELVKLIGHYQLLIVVESFENTNLIKDLRSEFQINDYLIINIENITKYDYIPENL